MKKIIFNYHLLNILIKLKLLKVSNIKLLDKEGNNYFVNERYVKT